MPAAAKLAAGVDELIAHADLSVLADADWFVDLMKQAGKPPPWTSTKYGFVDAKGGGVGINLYGVQDDLVRLVIFALNSIARVAGETGGPGGPRVKRRGRTRGTGLGRG